MAGSRWVEGRGGRKFDKKTGKSRARTNWEESHGKPVPPGKHLHHIDGNSRNDAVENLQVVSPEEHAEIHPWLR